MSLINRHGIWVRGDMEDSDMFAVDEVYLRDEYEVGQLDDELHGAKLIVDVGAHIGCFSKWAHERYPSARVVSIECCPENLEVLERNVGDFATIVPAACTYERGELAMLNSVMPDGRTLNSQMSTIFRADMEEEAKEWVWFMHWVDRRPVRKVTLEEILEASGESMIDLLKLDCEGSEYSILEHADSSRVRWVVGEWHDTGLWRAFRSTLERKWVVHAERFHDDRAGWFVLSGRR